MIARELMTPRPRVCYGDSSLADAARLMWDHRCGFLPVVESVNGRLCGVITDRDICMGGMTQGIPLHEIPVRHCCSRGIVACQAGDGVGAVARLMREAKLHRLPVIEDSGKVIGVISLDDLAVAACRELGAEGPVLRQEVAMTLASVREDVPTSHEGIEGYVSAP